MSVSQLSLCKVPICRSAYKTGKSSLGPDGGWGASRRLLRTEEPLCHCHSHCLTALCGVLTREGKGDVYSGENPEVEVTATKLCAACDVRTVTVEREAAWQSRCRATLDGLDAQGLTGGGV